MAKHKRHHDGYRSEGKHKMGESHYAGMENRMSEESHDGNMIREDHMAMANLPQEVMMKPYPRESGMRAGYLDDGIKGIDDQLREDNSQMMRALKPRKY